MLRQALKMRGFRVVGQDDKVGTIHDFYFDAQNWTSTLAKSGCVSGQ
jgi:hypothetical protein